MEGLNIIQVAVGVVALIAGLGVLLSAIRSGKTGESPTATAMLIGGMMLATFGLLMAAFAIAYTASPPADLNAEVSQ